MSLEQPDPPQCYSTPEQQHEFELIHRVAKTMGWWLDLLPDHCLQAAEMVIAEINQANGTKGRVGE